MRPWYPAGAAHTDPVAAVEEFVAFFGFEADDQWIATADSAILRAEQRAFPLLDALCLGGTGGIRTPGTLRFVRFQGGCIRPLCHRSVCKVSECGRHVHLHKRVEYAIAHLNRVASDSTVPFVRFVAYTLLLPGEVPERPNGMPC